MTESFSKNFIDYEEYPQSGKCPSVLSFKAGNIGQIQRSQPLTTITIVNLGLTCIS